MIKTIISMQQYSTLDEQENMYNNIAHVIATIIRDVNISRHKYCSFVAIATAGAMLLTTALVKAGRSR